MRDLISVTIMVRDTGKILDKFLKKLKTQKVNLPYRTGCIILRQRR